MWSTVNNIPQRLYLDVYLETLSKSTSDTEKNLYSIKDTIFINQFPPELNVNK